MSTAPQASSAEANPRGVDLTDSGKLQELERYATPVRVTTDGGKRVESENDNRKEPDWKRVEAFSETLLAESQDLRAASYYVAAKLRNDRFRGLAQGLQLMWQMLERWGLQAYPVVDTTNRDSVLERLLTIVSIAAPYKRDGDLLRIVEGVRKTPLVSASTTEFDYAYLLSAGKKGGEEGKQMLEVFRQAWLGISEKEQRETIAAIESSLTSLANITRWIKESLPEQFVPSDSVFSSVAPLVSELEGIRSALRPAQPKSGEILSAPANNQPTGDEKNPHAANGGAAPCLVQNRGDAVSLLTQVNDYLKAQEPSSPAIFYIDKAKTLIGKNFQDVLFDIMPESATKFQDLLRIAPNKDKKTTS
jgi:type VI secretion system protein ImpA